jgi:cullin 3
MANSGLDAMIDHDKIDDLSRLYSLYGLIRDGVPCLRRTLKISIERRGAELNKASMEGREAGDGGAEDEPDPSPRSKGKVKARPPNAGAHGLAQALRWVEDVLHMKDRFDGIWETAFKGNREIESGLNEVNEIGFIFLLWD